MLYAFASFRETTGFDGISLTPSPPRDGQRGGVHMDMNKNPN